MFNFSLINLGCTKNLVDSQYLIWKILTSNNPNDKVNFIPDPYSSQVEYVFLNTCGFLSSWRQEMMETLKSLLDAGKKIYLLWCAVQYFNLKSEKDRKVIGENQKKSEHIFLDEYEKEKQYFEEFLKKNVWKVFLLSWDDLDYISVDKLKRWYFSKNFGDFTFPNSIRAYTNAYYGYEYLKIAEGCNNSCSFCIIPKIRWKQKSLPIEKILQEAKNMVNNWVKEIIIISQDTTRYWIDLYKQPKLFDLLEQLDELDWDFVYRILYLYPDIVSLKHLEKFKKLKKFLPYFDIPLQHINSNVLKLMWRFYNTSYIYDFLDFIKENFPESFIRTNFIVWFPWETDEAFKELLDFIDKDYFDNIALFEYHDEPLAKSSKLPNKVDDLVLKERFKIISDKVDNLLDKKNEVRKKQLQIGYVQDILDTKIVVRPYLHCPEIDPVDEIDFKNVKWVYNQTGEIEIWDLIEYKIV